MTEVLYLTAEEVADLAEMSDYVEASNDGFRQRGEGADADNPDKSANADDTTSLISYSAALPDSGVMGGYMFSTGEGVDGWYITVLFDDEDGTPLAVLDGGSWNPFKTGSAAGVATDYLARDDIETVGVIGSGSQARAQVEAIDVVRDFDHIQVFSPTREHREDFAAEVAETFDVEATAVDSSKAAVEGADILVSATKASGTVFEGEWLEAGTHVNAVGYERIDAASIQRTTYVCDHEERALDGHSSFTELLSEGEVTEDDYDCELGDIVGGDAVGRTEDDEITLFSSSGTAVETIAGANMLYNRALDAGLGSTVDLTPASEGFSMASFVKAYQRE
ncbi:MULTISPECIES: ornithine cyclodeaminase family protein [Salinibaculum]|uniref:ornithine cyclodeaminase family protein n=1 Tax=Salinibaculum TaxID=2732368 RepID=UPI0030CBA1FE